MDQKKDGCYYSNPLHTSYHMAVPFSTVSFRKKKKQHLSRFNYFHQGFYQQQARPVTSSLILTLDFDWMQFRSILPCLDKLDFVRHCAYSCALVCSR